MGLTLSRIPTSGGQYFWVAVLAPQRYRRYLSYITGKVFSSLLRLPLIILNIGWLCAITWQAGVAGAAYEGGTLVQALFVLNNQNYVYERWQGSLLTLAFLLIGVIFNTFLAKKLPTVEGLFVFCHILGAVIFIPCWVLAPTREGGSPLVNFYNPSGWSSNGLATLVGATAPITTLIGFDCSIHMGMLIP
jgi:Amino acid permease